MDIYCKFCREPWETDCLHDAVKEGYHRSFDTAREAFYAFGCNAFDGIASPCKRSGGSADPVLELLQELAGDDIDGLASDIDFAIMDGLI